MSPYAIPSDVWALYEEKVQAAGRHAISTPGSNIILDVVTHPRNLNLLFIAYGGGIVLSDLDILLPRRPAVTALAVHPSGHIISVGYADGSIAFWALEDEDRPLLVRTLDDEEDVGVMNVDKLEAALPSGQPSAPHQERSAASREPIFKLSWSGFPNSSDPRGGNTVLTVLGGLAHDSSPGLTTFLLPPLSPHASPASDAKGKGPASPALHPDTRAAMVASLLPLDSYAYNTVGAVQDFLLIPRANPHFAGAWDPQAVLLLSDSDLDPTGATRVVEALEFPPPAFAPSTSNAAVPEGTTSNSAPDGDLDSALANELASTLQSMSLSEDPMMLNLPSAFGAISDGVIWENDRHAMLPIRGGKAWLEDTEGQMKLMKFQPRRVLITHDHDLVLHFYDLSAQSLVSSFDEPLTNSLPDPLPSLMIELSALLFEPSLRPSPSDSTHTTAAEADSSEIDSILLAPNSLECITVFRNGAVILHRLDVQSTGDPPELEDDELVSLAHLSVRTGLRYSPFCAIRSKYGRVTACAISDVDPVSRIRLIAVSTSGHGSVYTLARSPANVWTIPDTPAVSEGCVQTAPGGSFVLDAKSGARLRADPQAFAAVLANDSVPQQAENAESDTRKHGCIWVNAGAKGAKCIANLVGDRIAKVDWSSRVGRVIRVEVVEKNGGCALVAFTEPAEALIYSLPFLEHLHTLQLPEQSLANVSTDPTGDYITFVLDPTTRLTRETRYGTLFGTRRAAPYAPPLVDLAFGRPPVPPQPAPVSLEPQSVIGSVLGYLGRGVMSGAEIDALLAGPDRPEPPQSNYDPAGRVPPSSKTTGKDKDNTVKSAADSMSTGVSDLYNKLGTALAERGQMLGDLEESFNSLEQGSKGMLSQISEKAVIPRGLTLMIPFLGVVSNELTVFMGFGNETGERMSSADKGRSTMYLRGRPGRVTVVGDILVDQNSALRNRWRVLEKAELLEMAEARSMCMPGKRRTDLDEAIELSPDGLDSLGNPDRIVKRRIRRVDLVSVLLSKIHTDKEEA
ncbi:hypothetical protein POSPLADRAFT_1063938 [Postia placenta MAD-698-R-SB12]|uniref:Lethal giant larvae (Lgl)-like C-terminal domain-containing protein n=1 Tax=Postia placenta MAD-698-R-SB12 TaxID=670580 RepID=A0A1X6NER5_9APHY|nr:hypothetical protein POSPLADRAFT_1063938 [Postia placenta MAD-698-R-SB12]OSX67117.1 hypothetical protein POSPLADRAFT_1063938 [Postia placenta MAD-698-R-SB12]